MTIEDIKHCLNVMVDVEVCEECNLYGTTGTDHCEHDCVCGALDIINKYQKIEEIMKDYQHYPLDCLFDVRKVLEDGNAEPALTKDYTNYMRPMCNL